MVSLIFLGIVSLICHSFISLIFSRFNSLIFQGLGQQKKMLRRRAAAQPVTLQIAGIYEFFDSRVCCLFLAATPQRGLAPGQLERFGQRHLRIGVKVRAQAIQQPKRTVADGKVAFSKNADFADDF